MVRSGSRDAADSWARLAAWPRVGVLGGSFDPPHCGHVLLATYALAVGPFDALLVVPSFAHPFGKRSAAFVDRLALCEAAFAVLDPSRVFVSSIESELPAPSYTWRTLEEIARRLPRSTLRLVVGSDVARERDRWERIDRVEEIAPFFVVGRTEHTIGGEHAPLELPAVSSTEVRARLEDGRDVTGLVPTRVASVIASRGLYRAANGAAPACS